MNRYGRWISSALESSPVFAGGGSTCRLQLTRPAIYRIVKRLQRGILGMTLLSCSLLIQPSRAQTDPLEVGAWSYILDSQQNAVVWRQSTNPSWDQAVGDYAAANS